MAIADQLLKQMFSWIEQRESCAKQLKKLAQELESLREKCNASECVGSTVAVAGAACVIGAGVATLLTAGLAAPLLAVGAVSSGLGAAVSLSTKITEHFLSSNTLKEAQNIEQKSNEIAERIQKLFQQLKEEGKKEYSISDPNKLDQYVMAEILGAMARRSSLQGLINFHKAGAGQGLNVILSNPALIVGFIGIMGMFTLKPSGEKLSPLIAKGVEKLIQKVAPTAVKTAFKGGAMVVGGAVGMGFALSDAIDNWTDLIEKNHVTEASQSLRDTADAILMMTKTLMGQFDDMKRKLQEEEKLSRRKRGRDC